MKRRFKQYILRILVYWKSEWEAISSDRALLLLLFAAPIFYPIIYGSIYDNEVVKEAELIVVDHSQTAESRRFCRLCDATREVKIVAKKENLKEAERAIQQKEAYGIIEIPSDFSKKLIEGEKSYLTLFSDMSSLLYYKNYLQTLTNVSLEMNKEIQIKRLNKSSSREEDIAVQPIIYQESTLYNTSNGFGSFLIPGVIMLLIQQTLIIAICALNGKRCEENTKPTNTQQTLLETIFSILGRSFCYIMIYCVLGCYLFVVIPYLFSLPQIGNYWDIMGLYLPYLFAVVYWGLFLSNFFQEKEEAYLYLVFTSVILLFLSGISWPVHAIPTGWKVVSYLIPSTFEIQGFIKINTMGAELSEITWEYIGLWLQAVGYFALCILAVQTKRDKKCVRTNNPG
ncbi:MAG: ABC transporter permease [Paludibacteraceae bacterium]|nr:ABC transporter permease [Paludibacteraceae bacterium]